MRSAVVVFPALLLGLSFGNLATSQAPAEVKLAASDGAAEDRFGGSLAVSGDTALVRAWFDDDAGSDSGSAYVFVRSGTGWIQQAKLTASDAAAGDVFGSAVAVSGDTAIVGAYGDDGVGTDSGSAYVFVRVGTSWIQQAKLIASDAAAGDLFGFSVALHGDTALVGAPFNDDAMYSSGSVYAFVRVGTSWIQQAKLTASDAAAADYFGYAIALSEDTTLVGALGDDDAGRDSGSAYVFARSGTSWSQQAKLTASDGAAQDWFGRSVTLSGDTALVGSRFDDDAGNNSGSAYAFVRVGTSWAQQAKLTASDASAEDLFGFSVALSGETALVGALGDDVAGVLSGSAYVFARSGTSWVQRAKLTASDGAAEDRFGGSVGLSMQTALVGAPFNRAAGSAYVYELGLATVNEFGAGCGGTFAIPVLESASLPRTGGAFDVVLSGLPANNATFLVLGLSNLQWLSMSLPMSLAPFGAPGCSLLVSGDSFTRVINTTGSASQRFTIPLDPSLVGLHIYLQGFVEDPGANAFGVAASNALDVIIGSF